MRVTGGEHCGRSLVVPKSDDIRPTQDRVRQALFNILSPEIGGAVFLDLFAGCGAVGIEALSRGAASVTFVERDRRHAAALRQNVTALRLPPASCDLVVADVYRWLSAYVGPGFTMAFADPPYRLGEERGYAQVLATLAGRNVVRPDGLFIAEMTAVQHAEETPGWDLLRDKTYGKTRLCIWRRISTFVVSGLLSSFVCLACTAGAKVGTGSPDTRPYEFVDAGRERDEISPWIDFEGGACWTAETVGGGTACAETNARRMLFGRRTLEVTSTGATEVVVRPAKAMPLPVSGPEWVGVWVCSDGLGYYSGASQAYATKCELVFREADGRAFQFPLMDTSAWMRNAGFAWKDWFYCPRKLTAAERARLSKPGVVFDGFRLVTERAHAKTREYHFDNIAFFNRDETNPLDLKPYAGGLPFPNRPEGARPESSAGGSNRVEVAADGSRRLVYEGQDGRLVYVWRGSPATLTARWNDGAVFRPMAGGGAMTAPEKAAYDVSIAGKTLVVSVFAPAGEEAVSYGRPEGVRLVARPKIPVYCDVSIPAVDDGKAVLFVHVFADWYESRASRVGPCSDAKDACCGSLYRSKTDGAYNPVSERLYLTVSPEIAETFPTIANPPSPWKSVTGTHAWTVHGSSPHRELDKRFWRHLHRCGIRHVVITDHESCMRDDGESFTFRTKPAPRKGGEAAWRDYADCLIGELGYRYGPYNNFTDFAPVNANWSLDRATRHGDGNLHSAWIRCWNPKPAYARVACRVFPPQLKRTYGFNTAYCDVHTAVRPWDNVDFDARVPEAGQFRATYRAYGEILLSQKDVWQGPVWSEGSSHFFYAGLADGNYAQLGIDSQRDPWIVDFDLRKVHPLECDFGCGSLGMFNPKAGKVGQPGFDADVDQFLAATLAFGHTPFLLSRCLIDGGNDGFGYVAAKMTAAEAERLYQPEKGLPYALRSYFMVQSAAAHYSKATAERIRYLSDDGRWRSASAAIAEGDGRMNRIAVSYSDGTCVVANGDRTNRLSAVAFGRRLDLPPCGYAVWNDRSGLEVEASDRGGARTDYASCGDYIYFDTRTSGAETVRKNARGIGIAVCRREDGGWEILPFGGMVAFRICGSSARALDETGKDLGPAVLSRTADGFVAVKPVSGAFSYLVK